MRRLLAFSFVMSLLSIAAPAAAQEAAPAPAPAPAPDTPDAPTAPTAPTRSKTPADALRSSGTVVLDDVVGGSLGALSVTVGWFTLASSTNDQGGEHAESHVLRFAPSADFFVVDGLSLGGSISVGRESQTITSDASGLVPTDTTTTSRSFAPRVGYAFRISDDLLFWPRAQIGFGTTDTTTSASSGSAGGTPGAGTFGAVGSLVGVGANGVATSGTEWWVGGDAALVYVLGRHAAVAAGPYAVYQFAKQDDPHSVSTTFSINLRGSLRLAF